MSRELFNTASAEMVGGGQSSWSPMCPSTATDNALSKSATVSDFRRLSRQPTPEPSPQAWLASSKRRIGVLDPPASPLDMLSPITEPLDAAQWNKRMSLLTHRYLIEYGVDRGEEIVDKAFRTLELFCVGNEAEQSLKKFKVTFARLSTTSLEQDTNNLPERSNSWISFPSFLDDSFNLSHTSLSFDQQPLDAGTLSDITHDVINRQSQAVSHNSIKRRSFRLFEKHHTQTSAPQTRMSAGPRPRYMTPTLASNAQTNTPQPQSRPATPASAGLITEKRGWMANAGRRLGITTPKSRREDRVPDNSATGSQSPSDVTNISKRSQTDSRINKASAQKTVRSSGSDVKRDAFNTRHARLSQHRGHTAPLRDEGGITYPRRRGSPPDKPLPSLPVATIRPRSPLVRRSLIDASEKPLRKSLSPSSGVEIHEEWPAIAPSRLTSAITLQPPAQNISINSATITTNQEQIHESLLKGQGSQVEKVEDNKSTRAKHNSPAGDALVLLGADPAVPKVLDDPLVKVQGERAMEVDEIHASTGIQGSSVPAATVECSGQVQPSLPDWRPRQTKTSMMRAHLSSGSDHLQEKESKFDDQIALLGQSSPHSYSRANANNVPKRLSIPGPVRSRSRSRRTVSARNSPYGQGNRVSGRVVKPHMNVYPSSASPDREMPSTTSIGAGPDLIAVKEATTLETSIRKSHTPVRRQFSDSEPKKSEVDILVKRSGKYASSKDEERSFKMAEEADIVTDHNAPSVHGKETAGNGVIRQVEGKETVNEPEAGTLEISCSSPETYGLDSATTPQVEIQLSPKTFPSFAFEEDVSLSMNSTGDSDVMSLRDFAATEPPNYRVKRLSLAAPEHGPTLRIAEDAEELLMGTYCEEENIGEEREASKGSSTPDLWRSALLRKQLKSSKDTVSNGQLLVSRSTTSRSLIKLGTGQNRSIATESLDGDAQRTSTKDVVADSQAHSDRLGRGMGNNPFVANECSSLRGDVAEHCLSKDEQWPLRSAEASHPDLRVLDRRSEEEDSWLSSLATAVAQKRETTATLTPATPNNTTTRRVRDRHEPSNEVSAVETHRPVPIKDVGTNDGTKSAEGHSRPPFPSRISSRTQFRDMIQHRSGEDRPVINHRPTDPEIPNRFASVRSMNQLKATSTPLGSISRLESIRRLDHNTTTNGFSSLRQRHALDSARTQHSATKGMLSNFRGLFHKRSLENTDTLSTMSSNDFVPQKHAAVSKSGSPFSLISTPVSLEPLSTGPSSRNPQVTQTPNGITGDKAIGSISPAFVASVCRETQDAERLAVQILDSALLETNAQRRSTLGQLGQLMVQAVTAAKDAEKAMEEARQAAAMAEVHSMDAKRCLWHVSEMVERMLEK